MNYKCLQQAFRYEFQLTNNNYNYLSLTQMHDRDENAIFDVNFVFSFQTLVFCNRAIDKGMPVYTITKIVSLLNDGTVLEFKSIADFVEYIKNLENVRLINVY